jgi:ACS family hexuronate transporter-like MFS transporter
VSNPDDLAVSRGARWTIACVATFAMSVSYIDRQVLAVIAESVRDALSIDHEQFGWLLSAFSMAYLVGTPLAGWLVDKVGARIGLVVAMLVWSAISASHAFVSSFAMLFALRIALGTAESPSFPGAAQSIRRSLERRDRSAGFGLLFTGSSIGSMVAAPVAIALKIHFGWRAAFAVVALLGLAWVPAWLAVTAGAKRRRMLSKSDDDVPGVPTISRAKLLFHPAVLRALVLVVASAPTVMFVINWAPQYLEHAFNVPENAIGHYFWLPAVFFDLGAVGIGLVASRRERASTVIRSHIDLTIVAGAMCASLALAPLAQSPWQAVGIASLALGGAGGLFARLTADMVSRVGVGVTSTATGMTAAAQSLSYIIAAPAVGRAVDATKSFNGPLVVIGLLVIPGVVAWLVWPMGETPETAVE